MKEVSITEGKRDFTSLLTLSEKGELITLMRRKKPVAVIVPHSEYKRIKKIMNYFAMKAISEELRNGTPALSAILEESRKILENRNVDDR
jgi:prevent-host-death family protein